MLKEGALDKVEAIFGLHVAPDMPVGSIESRPGPLLAGSGRFLAIIKGRGGHAARPQDARDPVLAASSAILALQHIISRETDPLEARVTLSFPFSSTVQKCDFCNGFEGFIPAKNKQMPSMMLCCDLLLKLHLGESL